MIGSVLVFFSLTTPGFVVLRLAVLIPSVILHEVAHGYVAYRCGDDTAKRAGRLTLNPIPHIDPVGTILMPILLTLAIGVPFGYAKPVPVSINRLRKPRNQSVYVALAGPATTLILAAVGWGVASLMISGHFGWFFIGGSSSLVYISGLALQYFFYFGLINVVLFIFNMLPIPPLDGSAVVERLWPREHLSSYFEFRNRAMPILFVVVIAAYIFHWTDGASTWIVNKYISLFPFH